MSYMFDVHQDLLLPSCRIARGACSFLFHDSVYEVFSQVYRGIV
jgi:hypothetical protein